MDRYWEEAANFLAPLSAAGAFIVAPIEMREFISVSRAAGDVAAAEAMEADAFVLYKGDYQSIDRQFICNVLARLHASFANEVFIVFTAGQALDADNPHLSKLSEIHQWAASSDPTGFDQPEAAQDAVLRHIALARWWDELRRTPRAMQPLRLTRFGRKAFSQNDEDGIILEIFRRIGAKSRRFVEFGVEDGTQCNTALLLATGWSGLWIEGNGNHVAAARRRHAHMIAAERLRITHDMVTAENIDHLLEGLHGPLPMADVDLLSIDIDYNDYWVWKAITVIQPRVVAIEYNATYPPPLDFLAPYDPNAVWNTTNYYGASLSMLEKLGADKGYALVGCCLAGVNAFFVRSDELLSSSHEPRFLAPYTAAEHYEPPRYELSGLSCGHRAGFGPNAAPGESE